MELFLTSPLYLFYVFLLGVIVGSFLNVFIYRFHTGRSINGSSHCLSCQLKLEWFELVPLLSYVVLKGRCRHCGSNIPRRYFLVELLTGLAFLLSASFFVSISWQIWSALFLSILICIIVYDLYHTIIPDELSLLLTALALVILIFQSFNESTWLPVGYGLLSGAAAAGPFVFLWVISDGRWIGLGDAKLAFPLGMMISLSAVFSFVVLAFWIGALISVILMLIQKILTRGQFSLRIFGRPLTMKSEVPFAPFLILSFLLIFYKGIDVFSLLKYVL